MTPFEMAQRFIGIKEVLGAKHNPLILAMLQLDAAWVEDDETPWCSAFVNFIHWLWHLPRSRSLAARSWILVGISTELRTARVGDIVVLTRGKGPQPGLDVIKAPGHVGFYAGQTETTVEILGANQANTVSIASFPKSRLLTVRRIT